MRARVSCSFPLLDRIFFIFRFFSFFTNMYMCESNGSFLFFSFFALSFFLFSKTLIVARTSHQFLSICVCIPGCSRTTVERAQNSPYTCICVFVVGQPLFLPLIYFTFARTRAGLSSFRYFSNQTKFRQKTKIDNFSLFVNLLRWTEWKSQKHIHFWPNEKRNRQNVEKRSATAMTTMTRKERRRQVRVREIQRGKNKRKRNKDFH